MRIALRQLPSAILALLASGCAGGGADASGSWSGETESGHTISFDVDGGSVSGQVAVNPDNEHGCDGTGSDKMTLDFDGSLSDGGFSASLHNDDHPTNATITATFTLTGAEGDAEGGTTLYGIDGSGDSMDCDSRFSDPWTATQGE